jgi:hypothetical protein
MEPQEPIELNVECSITWEPTGSASLRSAKDDAWELLSTIPSPPGSRLTGRFDVVRRAGGEHDGERTTYTLRFKVHQSKRRDDGAFVLRGRVIDLPRELRLWLAGQGATARS